MSEQRVYVVGAWEGVAFMLAAIYATREVAEAAAKEHQRQFGGLVRFVAKEWPVKEEVPFADDAVGSDAELDAKEAGDE